jgi:hypothetical protein
LTKRSVSSGSHVEKVVWGVVGHSVGGRGDGETDDDGDGLDFRQRNECMFSYLAYLSSLLAGGSGC